MFWPFSEKFSMESVEEPDVMLVSSKDFQKTSNLIWTELLVSEDYSDITLVSSDLTLVKAHKAILGYSSEFFENLFKLSRSEGTPIVYLKGVQHLTLESMLTFIYTGECQVEKDNLASFLEFGNDMKISGLLNTCKVEDISNTNVKLKAAKIFLI